MKVHQLLQSKNNTIFSVTSESTVYEALVMMSEKNVGALLVIDNEVLSGILSERDYARKIVLKDKTSKETLVSEIMSANVITITREVTTDDCMQLMSKHKFRHLPVVQDEKVIGIISIGDIVNNIIREQQETIDHLHSYIAS